MISPMIIKGNYECLFICHFKSILYTFICLYKNALFKNLLYFIMLPKIDQTSLIKYIIISINSWKIMEIYLVHDVRKQLTFLIMRT